MDKEERRFFERMSKAQERLAEAQEQMTRVQERMIDAMEKQQPSKADKAMDTAVATVAVLSVFNVVDLIIKWITGG